MPNVVFVAPYFMDTTLRFIEAVAEHPGSRTVLIGQERKQKLPDSLRRSLAAYLQVDDVFDSKAMTDTVRQVAERAGSVDRLLGTLEHLQVPLAQVREALDIPGLGVAAAESFRDKARMKTLLQEAGLPCARHQRLESAAEAADFAAKVGFPVVIKPLAGAGSKDTFQVANQAELDDALRRSPPHPQRPMLAEEFVSGDEHSFDGISIDGKLVWHSLSHYLPGCLEAIRQPWVQWCLYLPREVEDPRYDDIRQAAASTLEVLGQTTGVCHLEWFRRPDGSLAISEVGARPGGVQLSRLISYANDFDYFRALARLMVDHRWTSPQRKYACGAAFLRGQGTGGRVKAIHGIEQAHEELGPLVVETHLPQIGQPASGTYEGEGWVILRHPETDVLRRALGRLISLVRVELG